MNLPPLFETQKLVYQPSGRKSPTRNISDSIPVRSNIMPNIHQLKIINEPVKIHPNQPICMISFSTTSKECQYRMPYVNLLQKQFPRINFLLVSIQNFDYLIQTFMKIPELLDLNVACDTQGIFKNFMSIQSQLTIPRVFGFDEKGTLVCDGEPQSQELRTQLTRIQGRYSINLSPRHQSPSRLKEMKTKKY